MHIGKISDWPDAAQRIVWAKILEINPSTLYRADKDNRLCGSRPGGRTVVYTKKAILQWLGIELENGK
jgi:hypothetical protein